MSANQGWYPDPKNPNVQIYWNGEKWSASRLKSREQPSDTVFADGTRLPAAPPGYSAMPTKPARKPMGCFGFILIAVGVVVAIVIGLSVYGSFRNANPTDSDKQAESQVACEEVVKNNLKSPSTASFSNETATGTAGSYTVTGDVDSQNSFGAMIRNHFTCESDGSTVHLTSLG